ncbi:aldehyde dehydrogenase (NADP(+)) [Streptomyces sp. NPDC050504]|uniref:aldehyde dehydrogenase (NADP(+)) n=1 Tax=Streptomyces sp. NPDC050504 TaxID=3365618 RepID=UPI0037BA86F8
MAMSEVYSMDQRTGLAVESVAEESGAREVARVCGAAADAAAGLDRMGPGGRAALLEAVAVELEAAGAALVEAADRETALGADRLRGELVRTCGQLRFFAEVLREGSYADAVIDRATAGGDTGPGLPDMRRMLRPLGPVAVFGSSNFPLAFSVAGGDTASALAAGCPVVVKAHPSHPATSRLAFDAVARAVAAAGAPAGTVGIVWGFEAGRSLVLDPRIKAVGFTGSLVGGRRLHQLAASRPEPIPFHGELSSLNPVFVLPGAARDRAASIARDFVRSLSFGHGQVCTKPGLLLVPAGTDGDELRAEAAAAVTEVAPSWLLNDGIRAAFREGVERLSALPGVRTAAVGRPADDDERQVAACLLHVAAKELLRPEAPLMEECFGPFAVIAEYRDVAELIEVAEALEGQLSCAVHADEGEQELSGLLLDRLARSCGRIVWNGFTTGVTVGWATHHGGPYPATTSPGHTSVGASAVSRFLRPVCYQSVPDALLPPQLRNANPLSLPRRMDGVRA